MADIQVGTPFISVDHGFKFVNRFEVPFSVMFPLPFVSPIDLDNVIYGLCGGMCYGALDYFYAGKPIPAVDKVNDLDNRFLLYLWDRQLDSLKLTTVVRVMEWMLLESTTASRRVAQREAPKVKRRVDKGQPAVLALIRTEGVSNPTKNHQVMVTGYHEKPDTRDLVFDIYDPNYPGKKHAISMNLKAPSQGISLKQSSGEPLRGFFVLDYRRKQPL